MRKEIIICDRCKAKTEYQWPNKRGEPHNPKPRIVKGTDMCENCWIEFQDLDRRVDAELLRWCKGEKTIFEVWNENSEACIEEHRNA